MSAGRAAPAERRAASTRLGLLLPAAVGLVAVYAAWSGLRIGGEQVSGFVTDLGELAATLTALVLTGLRARAETRRSARAGWLLLSMSFVGFSIGDGTNVFYALVARSAAPLPSMADAGYAAGIALALPALLFLGGGAVRGSRLRRILDGGIVAGSALLVSWLTVLRAVYEAGAAIPAPFALVLAYPISDVVLVVVALSAVSQARRVDPGLLMVALGILAGAFGDSVFTYASAIGLDRTLYLVETGYFAASVFIAVGSRIGGEAGPPAGEPQLSRWQIVLPYVPPVLAGALARARSSWPLATRWSCTATAWWSARSGRPTCASWCGRSTGLRTPPARSGGCWMGCPGRARTT